MEPLNEKNVSLLVELLTTLLAPDLAEPDDPLQLVYQRNGLNPSPGVCRLAAIAAATVLLAPRRAQETV